MDRRKQGITLQHLLRAWSNILKLVLDKVKNDRFSATDVESRVDQLKKKVSLTSLSRGGRAYYEGANLLMSQSPITIDTRWGNAADFRHVEIHVHLRIAYNPLQSPVVKEQLNKFQTDPRRIKFTNADIEEYNGDKRLESFKETHYEVVCSSAREVEDANDEWYQDIWYDSKKIHKFCLQKIRDGTSYEAYFGRFCDLVS